MRERQWAALIALILATIAAYVAAAATSSDRRRHEQRGTKHGVFPVDDSAWHDSTPGLPAGSRFAVVSGDPTMAAPFVMRVELPPGYTVAPYRRAYDENIVVLAGALELGAGEKFDEQSLRTLPSGSFVQLSANEPHFVTSPQGATVQIHGTGPFTLEYVAAAR